MGVMTESKWGVTSDEWENDKTPLTKGMYGNEFSGRRGRFNIRCGQVRADDYQHNVGWYNAAGEKLGWGDLSREDLKNIAAGLEPGESFILLRESASYWDFRFPGVFNDTSGLDPEAPGADYVNAHAHIIITKNCIKHVKGR
jgi:hypothetical protein